MAELRRTPLYAVHRESGAKMVAFGGWEMPVEYARLIAEHLPVRPPAAPPRPRLLGGGPLPFRGGAGGRPSGEGGPPGLQGGGGIRDLRGSRRGGRPVAPSDRGGPRRGPRARRSRRARHVALGGQDV